MLVRLFVMFTLARSLVVFMNAWLPVLIGWLVMIRSFTFAPRFTGLS